jgi:hypothetical protein
MNKLRLAVTVFICACQEPPPYELQEAEIREFAEHRCQASTACCDMSVDAESCTVELVDSMSSYHTLTDATLTFSRSCMDALQRWAPEIDCGTAADLEAPGCQIAHGDRARGEACIEFGDLGFFGTDCDVDLQCLAGRCVDDPFFVTQRAQEDERCDPYTLCETDLYCSSDGTCRRRSAPGDSCSEANQCGPAADYYCRGLVNGAGECVPKSQLGEPCDPAELACAFACDSEGSCQLLDCIEGSCAARGPVVCELP